MSVSPTLSRRSNEEVALTDEKLERAFREIEEASARRAEEEDEAESFSNPIDRNPFPALDFMSPGNRRRKSISVSRIGSHPDMQSEPRESVSGATSPVPFGVATMNTTGIYRVNTVSSTSSATSTDSEHTDLTEHHEEDLHTTQKETITARRNTLTKAMSNAFSRTLTRMRSRGALNEANNSEGTLVIGVAVHETETEEAAHEDEPGLSEGAEATASTSDRTGEGEEGRFASIKRASISMRTAEVSVVAPASTKSESRSRSGSVNKLRSVLPLRSQNSTSESRPMPAPASGPPTPAMEESPKLEVTDAEGKIDDSAKKAKIGRRLSSLAKSFSQTLRRKKSDERTKERGTITNKGMFDAPLATATGSSSSVEKDLPSPTPVPPVPVPSDAVTEPLPPSPSSKPAALVKKVSSSLLAPDMVALPASPVASSFSSTRSPMRIDTDNRSDKASATASPASPNESFSNSIPILEKLDGVLEVAKEVMASNEDLQSTAPEGTATQRLVSDGSSYISKQNTISIIEERPSAEEPETTKEASGTGKSSEVGTAPSS